MGKLSYELCTVHICVHFSDKDEGGRVRRRMNFSRSSLPFVSRLIFLIWCLFVFPFLYVAPLADINLPVPAQATSLILSASTIHTQLTPCHSRPVELPVSSCNTEFISGYAPIPPKTFKTLLHILALSAATFTPCLHPLLPSALLSVLSSPGSLASPLPAL